MYKVVVATESRGVIEWPFDNRAEALNSYKVTSRNPQSLAVFLYAADGVAELFVFCRS